MTNEELLNQAELVQKAMITTDSLAAAGKLNPEQANKFIDYVIDITMLKNNVRVVRVKAETRDIDKIGVGTRVSVPKEEAKDPGLRRGVTTSKVQITPVDIMTPFEISDTFTEINIEGENVVDTIVRMMATQTANDIEELLINGDLLGHARLESDMIDGGSTTQYVKDSFMALFDGWWRKADQGSSHIYDAEGDDISSTIFSRMIQALPVKFRRMRRDLRFLCSPDHEQLYREKIAARATSAGDAAISSEMPLKPWGIPLIGVPLLEPNPLVVEHITFSNPLTANENISLRYGPIETGSVVVTLVSLAGTPTTKLIEDTDYSVNYTTGVITVIDEAALDDVGTAKVTYRSEGQILLTNFMNLIFAIGRDVRIERDRDIFKSVHQFAITTKIYAQIEETDAIVKGINIGLN